MRPPELEIAEYHALSLRHDTPDSRNQAMESLIAMDKERLIRLHHSELDARDRDNAAWRQENAALGDVIRKQRKRIDRMMLVVVGAALIVAYFAIRDLRC